MVHGEYGRISGFDDRLPPIYEKFFLGGILTLRGFQYRSVGPKDLNGEPTGGTEQLYFNAEIIVPVAPAQGFNLVVFYDTGNAWDVRGSVALNDLRQSAGFGIRWMSPMGPFRLEWGYILDPAAGRAAVGLGLHDRQLLLVVTAAEKGPSAASGASLLTAAHMECASFVG